MTTTFSYQNLFDFSRTIFIKIGCPEADAATAAKALLSADLRGVDSHGVARLSGYIRLWEVQRVNAAPAIRVVHETPSTAVVDGDRVEEGGLICRYAGQSLKTLAVVGRLLPLLVARPTTTFFICFGLLLFHDYDLLLPKPV